MAYFAEYDSPVGRLLLESDGQSLTGLWMGRERDPEWTPGGDVPVLLQVRDWLGAYFRGEVLPVNFPLNPRGTAFQKQVWEILLTIPFGQTRSYGSIAREMALRLGKERMSAQAVGGAVGRNPISILIPCHRVLGSQGQLTGYAWGTDRKRWLLEHEGIEYQK